MQNRHTALEDDHKYIMSTNVCQLVQQSPAQLVWR